MTITNRLGLPQFVVEALSYSNYDRANRDDKTISVTELIDSPYIWHLRKQHGSETVSDVADMMWSMIGQIGHEIAARAGSNLVKEVRLKQQFDDYTITGQFDIYDLQTKTLYDNKFTTQWTLIHNPAGKTEWHGQTNIYAYMMRKQGIPVENIMIIVWLRDMLQSDKLKHDRPDNDIVPITIPVWTDGQCEDYIRARISLFEEAHLLTGCSFEDRWAKSTRYAIKKPTATKAYRLYDTIEEARVHCTDGYVVEVRPGEDTRCERFCELSSFCAYRKKGTALGLFNKGEQHYADY